MAQRIALFVDVDNLYLSVEEAGYRQVHLALVLSRVREEGLIASARAYADWVAIPPGIHSDFQRSAFELIQLSTRGVNRQKNTADILMALDALEMALSPRAPETFVLVSGDRDFVPLVQKLRRHGARVVGIGVRGRVSPVLEQACDAFVFYDDLLPAEREPGAEAPRPTEVDREPAYALLARAAYALQRQGRHGTLEEALRLMQQLDSTFDPSRYGVGFGEIVQAARAEGYVQVVERDGEMLVQPGSKPLPDLVVQAESPRERPEYGFETAEEAAHSYRAMLLDANLPLVPIRARELLVRDLWEALAASPDGMTIDEMRQHLLSVARSHDLGLPDRAVRKIADSLNIAGCFSADQAHHAAVHVEQFPYTRVITFHPVEVWLRRLHANYFTKLLLDRPETPLIPEAGAILLYGRAGEAEVAAAREAIADAQETVSRFRGRPHTPALSRPATILYDTSPRQRPEAAAPSVATAPLPAVHFPPEYEADFALLREALAEVVASGEEPKGSVVRRRMQSFAEARGQALRLSRYGPHFADFVAVAAEAGVVRFTKPPRGDIVLSPA